MSSWCPIALLLSFLTIVGNAAAEQVTGPSLGPPELVDAPLQLALTSDLPARPVRPQREMTYLGGFSAQAFACKELSLEAITGLTLADTVRHVMCRSPLLLQALQQVNEKQAGLEVAQLAYRPRFSIGAELAANRIPTNDSSAGSTSSSATGALGVTWVLYDGGARAANVAQSRFNVSSAQFSRQAAELNTLNQALQLYVDAASASARLTALRETEDVARQSLQVAKAKQDAWVGSASEKLLAQTALAQATLDRVRAEGVWATARGLLAQAMGFSMDQVIALAPVEDAFPVPVTLTPGQEWLDAVMRTHPKVRGVQDEILALQTRLDALQAEYKGNVTFSAGVSGNRDLSQPDTKFDQQFNGSVYASLPIFSGAELESRRAQVAAQIANLEISLKQAEHEVQAEIWRNARQSETEAENFAASQQLVDVAGQSYDITLGRYRAGVGSMLELLSTQAALATARAQFTQARLGWVQARMKLEIATGSMTLYP